MVKNDKQQDGFREIFEKYEETSVK